MEKKLVAVFDIETSHPCKEHARVIELAYQILDPETLETLRSYSTLVYHGEHVAAIDEASSNVHGITEEHCCAQGRDVADVVYEVLDDWRDVGTLVSHGVDLDVEILALEFVRVLSYWPFSHCALVCTKELGAFACCIPRGRGGYKWPTLAELWAELHPEKTPAVTAHRAAEDVAMCADCYRLLFYWSRA